MKFRAYGTKKVNIMTREGLYDFTKDLNSRKYYGAESQLVTALNIKVNNAKWAYKYDRPNYQKKLNEAMEYADQIGRNLQYDRSGTFYNVKQVKYSPTKIDYKNSPFDALMNAQDSAAFRLAQEQVAEQLRQYAVGGYWGDFASEQYHGWIDRVRRALGVSENMSNREFFDQLKKNFGVS